MSAAMGKAMRTSAVRRLAVRVQAVAKPSRGATAKASDRQMQVLKSAALIGVSSELLASGQAHAAQEVATLAGDNRVGILLALFLPVVGWVGFNILGPAFNQFSDMSEKNKKSIAVGAGLGLAGLLSAGQADAAQEVVSLAGDSRVGVLGLLALPALAWVAFNIFGPASAQLSSMSEKANRGAVVGAGVGLAALLAAGRADAAQEVAALAGDNRVGILLALFLPVVGWVGFNILGPAFNQFSDMSDKNKKSIAVGTGLGMGALLSAGQADAAQEVASLAGDSRVGVLGLLALPALAWVAFNIFGPASAQLSDMSQKANRGAVVGTGAGLAALLTAGYADAAQEIATVAGDSRVGVLATLFLPVIGWVGFNILGPALNQVNDMSEQK